MKRQDIKSLSIPNMNNLLIGGKILSIAERQSVNTKIGHVAEVADATIADETGSIKLSLWDDQINLVKEGDIISIERAYTKEYLGEIILCIPKSGKLISS